MRSEDIRSRTRPALWRRVRRGLALAAAGAVAAAPAVAQQFNSGSTGADGPLLIDATSCPDATPCDFFALALDHGDTLYDFTTITVESGATVTLKGVSRGATTWIATGDVAIDGTVDLAGEGGNGAGVGTARPSRPGAGGFGGGAGRTPSTPSEDGDGPGGGNQIQGSAGTGPGGGHASAGLAGTGGGSGGAAYGNKFLLPILGGSGGSGGDNNTSGQDAGSGGAGGGALLIASSGAIRVDGAITANGGNGGAHSANTNQRGGDGSGGAIRLMAQEIRGAGGLSALGGEGPLNNGSEGRIRIEAFVENFDGATTPPAAFGLPGLVALSSTQLPLRITKVGTQVITNPTGNVVPADVQLEASTGVVVELESRGIPEGTTVELTVFPRTEVSLPPFTATVPVGPDPRTFTATVDIPHGFTRLFAEANFTP